MPDTTPNVAGKPRRRLIAVVIAGALALPLAAGLTGHPEPPAPAAVHTVSATRLLPHAPPGWFGHLRSILNQVGGRNVPLKTYNGNCGGQHADACSYPEGYIATTSRVGRFPQYLQYWAMTHELAHQYEFRVYAKLMKSKRYKSVFSHHKLPAFEELANAMAYVHGHGDGERYSSAEKAYARDIWKGIVR